MRKEDGGSEEGELEAGEGGGQTGVAGRERGRGDRGGDCWTSVTDTLTATMTVPYSHGHSGRGSAGAWVECREMEEGADWGGGAGTLERR